MFLSTNLLLLVVVLLPVFFLFFQITFHFMGSLLPGLALPCLASPLYVSNLLPVDSMLFVYDLLGFVQSNSPPRRS